MPAPIIGAAIIAVATIGGAMYSASEAKSQQKKLLEYQENQVRAAEEKAASAQALASAAASAEVMRKRRAKTQTIMTSPLGVSEANIGFPTLLGGK